MKIKFTFKIWLLIIILGLALLTIFGFPPKFLEHGVVIKDIETNSTAFNSGLRQGQIISEINDQKIESLEDYSNLINSLLPSNSEIKLVVKTNQGTFPFFTNKIPEMTIKDIPKTNIQTGLDLQGGARALIQPEKKLSNSEMDDLIAISNERFNVYGISDVSIRPVSDLQGDQYMLIEIAGTTPNELESLINEQGKFEAKIGNETVFVGGNKDITSVCRNDATCARIESCLPSENGYTCRYQFVIYISEQAAQRHADITEELEADTSNPGYLDKKIDFYVDDKLTESLFVSTNLKGSKTTQIQISGSGSGPDKQNAFSEAEASMKKMQTILITGSLPYKLEIVKLDTISPLLGTKFNKLILYTGLAALGAVALIIFLRYRKFKASFALIFTSFSEIVILLGVAALIKWNLDLPSIVGILVTIGTGVDQHIVILDESRSKRAESIRQKIKAALFIVVSAYFTTVVSLLPLYWAGAGLLKGFAVTTIIGLTIGVLITRPAFADIIRKIEEKNVS